MTNKERIFLISIPLLIIAVFFWKTPSGDEGDRIAISSYPERWQEVVDDTNEVIRLRWLMAGKGQVEPRMIEVLRRRWNIEVEPVFLSPEAMMQAQPLMLSAGDVPDVFDPGPNLSKYAENGYLMELPFDLLLQHAPNLMQELDRYSTTIWVLNMAEGKNFGIRPWVWHDGRMPRLGIWRMDWLEAVGIDKVPETLEEYEVALRRFRNDDPDGNGIKDTYGMTGDLTATYVTFTEIFGAFGVMPYNLSMKDGTVIWGGVQPEAKEALALLNRWYEEDLIHPEFLTDRWYQEVNTKFYNGEVGYVNYLSSYEAFREDNPASVLSKLRALQPGAELAPGVPPVGPRGERGHRVWGVAGSGQTFVFGRHMAERPQAVIRFIKMLDDLIVDEEAWRDRTIGEEGVHWRWKDPAVGPGSGITFLPPYDTSQTRERVGLPPDEIFINASQRAIYEKYLPRNMVEWNLRNRNPEWGRSDLFSAQNAVEMGDVIVGDLSRLQVTAYADIIRGEKPLDAFDDFVADWYAQGGDKYLQRAQEVYDEINVISQNVKEGLAGHE